MQSAVTFTLSYAGSDSEQNRIDFYDVSQALIGFERSIALTTHLILNNQIITHAPSLKGAKIYLVPPEPGSWKVKAAVVTALATGAYHLGTADRNTPLGHMIYSAYDYLVSEALGVHVDYDKSLGQLYEEAKRKSPDLRKPREPQLDSLIEKCSTAIREMHRPIYMSGTATSASIYADQAPLSTNLTKETFEYIVETHRSDQPEEFRGRVSSYNANTYKGRIYVPDLGRPIPFELVPLARDRGSVRLITSSLRAAALRREQDESLTICIKAFRNMSRTGLLKGLTVLEVSNS